MEEYLLEVYRHLILEGIANVREITDSYEAARSLLCSLKTELPPEQAAQVHELWERWMEYTECVGACSFLRAICIKL